MKKTNGKAQKLVVSMESIRSLTDATLENVAGGTTNILSQCIGQCSTKAMSSYYPGCPKAGQN